MRPRIAIPMPHGLDLEYAERAMPQYERAVELAGGEPVRIALNLSDVEVRKAMETCAGVLLPGSKADVDPARFHAARSPQTASADPARDAADNLLLDDAYRRHKPVLGICYGLQSLNVYRGGSLIQHIPDFLPEATRTKVNHEAGRTVAVAHNVAIEADSLLEGILCGDSHPRLSSRAKLGSNPQPEEPLSAVLNQNEPGVNRAVRMQTNMTSSASEGARIVLPVNSSHHQSADAIGKGLRLVARCLEDGIIEALENTDPEHFVLAVQWHPERSVDQDEASGAIFRALVEAAK